MVVKFQVACLYDVII